MSSAAVAVVGAAVAAVDVASAVAANDAVVPPSLTNDEGAYVDELVSVL
jgi:hypothetical protein